MKTWFIAETVTPLSGTTYKDWFQAETPKQAQDIAKAEASACGISECTITIRNLTPDELRIVAA